MTRVISIFFILFFLISCNKPTPITISKINYNITLPSRPANEIPVFVLDAGHGGMDSGGVNDSLKLYEKNVTRKIVDAMLKIIDPKKVKVIQTRIGDQLTNRHDRIVNANKFNPDLLMTIHTNFAKDTTISGFEISYSDSSIKYLNGTDTIKKLNPHREKLYNYSQILTKNVSLTFPTMLARRIAVRKDDIWMIYAPSYPAILVEFGFITNKKDVAIMQNPEEIKKLAKTLRNGVYNILGVKM